jgi:hypothetical protein
MLTLLTTSGMQVPNWEALEAASWMAHRDYLMGLKFPRHYQKLLSSPDSNTKFTKGGGLPIIGLTLAPAGMSGYQLCPNRSAECEAACLGVTAGRSRFSNVVEARIKKTRFLMESPYYFFRNLYHELSAMRGKYKSFAFRSNVLSDIPWEDIAPDIYNFSEHNYDYTKSLARALRSLEPHSPVNLTLSYSGRNWQDCYKYLSSGGNVAMVFNIKRNQELPQFHFRGDKEWCVIDGDKNDRRYLDTKGCIVGLRAKGNIDMSSPFVVKSFTSL